MAKEVFLKPVPEWTPVKNKGIEVRVNNSYKGKTKQLGDLIISKTGLVWCKGKTLPQNGIKISWDEFISIMESK